MKKTVLFVCLFLVFSCIAVAKEPYGVLCVYKTDKEAGVCKQIIDAFTATDRVRSAGKSGDWYALGLVVHEHSSGVVAVSIDVDYVNKDCNGLMFAAYQGVLALDGHDGEQEKLDKYVDDVLKRVSEWSNASIPKINQLCKPPAPLTASMEE